MLWPNFDDPSLLSMAHEVEVGMVLIRFDDPSLLSMAHEVDRLY